MEDYISFPMSFLHTKNIIFSNYASILRVQPAVKNKTMLGLSGRHVYPHEAITCTSTALELAYPLVSPPRSTSTILHPLLPSLHLSFSSPSAQTEHAASLPRDPHPDLPLLWDTPPLPPTPTAARIPPPKLHHRRDPRSTRPWRLQMGTPHSTGHGTSYTPARHRDGDDWLLILALSCARSPWILLRCSSFSLCSLCLLICSHQHTNLVSYFPLLLAQIVYKFICLLIL